MKKRNKGLFLVLVLSAGLLCFPQVVYGSNYIAGQSLIAEDQEAASKGLSFPGLDVTWLDFGEDHLQAFSPMPNQYSEGIFTLQMFSGMISFDTTGKIISAGDYNEVAKFSDGMALIRKYLPLENWQSGQLSAPPGYESGYIDNEGNEVIKLGTLEGLNAPFCEGLAVIGDYDQNKGYIDKTGEIVIPRIYLDAGDFSDGLAPVQSTETKLWGYIDRSGNQVISMQYDGAKSFHDGVAYVIKDGMAGYIDKTGMTVIDFQYPVKEVYDVDRSFYGGLAAAMDESGKYGYIDQSGAFVIAAKYREVSPFQGELALVSSINPVYLNGSGSSFLINRNGERVTPLWSYGYYSGETMEEGLYRVLSFYGTSQNQSIAMLNQYGAEVIPVSLGLENISPYNEGTALLTAFNSEGEMAVGLVKKPENLDVKKSGRLIRVFINGQQLDFSDTDPVIENAHTLAPMKDIFEAMGAEVYWDADNYTVRALKGETEVSLKISENTGYINGEPVRLDAPARIQNARTLIPIRFIAESFHAEIVWDDVARTIKITTTD